MLRMVDLLMRMRRALCWMHLEAICRLCSSLDFPTMLAMALNSAVMGNFLGLSFLWVIPVELSLWTGQTETWLILCLPALPGKNRSNRFTPLTIVHSIRHFPISKSFALFTNWANRKLILKEILILLKCAIFSLYTCDGGASINDVDSSSSPLHCWCYHYSYL